MICPKCGRVLEVGEICQCQALNVAYREAELANEKQENTEHQKIKYDKSTKEKSEKIQAASEKTDAAINSAMKFGKRMFECFKHIDKVDELYTDNADIKTSVILLVMHCILNFILVYLAFARSPVNIIFAAMSIFSSRVESALVIGSITISVVPMLVKIGIMKWKAQDNMLAEVTSEYIYTIPASLIGIIALLLNGTFGIAILIPIFIFGTIWTYRSLVKYKMNEYGALIIVTAASLIMSVLALIICNLIA